MPSIKQLEAFWWASTCVNFATAAQRLNLSVSSLSKRIAELEAALGEALFDRSGHRAVLTEAGERLLPTAQRVLHAMAELEQAVAGDGTVAGLCRFGVGDLSALTWLPQCLLRLRRSHPQLEIEPRVEVGQTLAQQLADGTLDCAVIAGRSAHPALQCEPAGAAHFAWAAAPALLDGPAPSVHKLLGQHPLVTLPRGAGTTRLLDDWLLTQRVPALRPIHCNSWSAIAGMLRAGLGVGFVPSAWIAPLGLREIGQNTPLAALQYAFHWRRGDQRPVVSTLRTQALLEVDFFLPPAWMADTASTTPPVPSASPAPKSR